MASAQFFVIKGVFKHLYLLALLLLCFEFMIISFSGKTTYKKGNGLEVCVQGSCCATAECEQDKTTGLKGNGNSK